MDESKSNLTLGLVIGVIGSLVIGFLIPVGNVIVPVLIGAWVARGLRNGLIIGFVSGAVSVIPAIVNLHIYSVVLILGLAAINLFLSLVCGGIGGFFNPIKAFSKAANAYLPYGMTLDDNEQLTEIIKGSDIIKWKVLSLAGIGAIILVIILFAVLYGISFVVSSIETNPPLFNIAYGICAFAVGAAIISIRCNEQYIYLTNKRVIKKSEIPSGRSARVVYYSIKLGDIANINVDQDFLGSILGYYSVEVDNLSFSLFSKDGAEQAKSKVLALKSGKLSTTQDSNRITNNQSSLITPLNALIFIVLLIGLYIVYSLTTSLAPSQLGTTTIPQQYSSLSSTIFTSQTTSISSYPPLESNSLTGLTQQAVAGQMEHALYIIRGGDPPYAYNFSLKASNGSVVLSKVFYSNNTSMSFNFTIPNSSAYYGFMGFVAKATDSQGSYVTYPTSIYVNK